MQAGGGFQVTIEKLFQLPASQIAIADMLLQTKRLEQRAHLLLIDNGFITAEGVLAICLQRIADNSRILQKTHGGDLSPVWISSCWSGRKMNSMKKPCEHILGKG